MQVNRPKRPIIINLWQLSMILIAYRDRLSGSYYLLDARCCSINVNHERFRFKLTASSVKINASESFIISPISLRSSLFTDCLLTHEEITVKTNKQSKYLPTCNALKSTLTWPTAENAEEKKSRWKQWKMYFNEMVIYGSSFSTLQVKSTFVGHDLEHASKQRIERDTRRQMRATASRLKRQLKLFLSLRLGVVLNYFRSAMDKSVMDNNKKSRYEVKWRWWTSEKFLISRICWRSIADDLSPVNNGEDLHTRKDRICWQLHN